MSLHFLLTAEAKNLSLIDIARMDETEARKVFEGIRWGDTGPSCPHCGCTEHWSITASHRYKCKCCLRLYSVTSGTIFADRKLPVRDYLFAILLFVNDVKGISMLKLSRDMKVNYKTAYLLCQKIRAALLDTRDETPMSGTVEMDALHTNYYIKPKNRKENRIDRRKVEKLDKRAIAVTRQRGEKGEGATRTLTHITKSENGWEMEVISEKSIEKGSILHVDESRAWDGMEVDYDVRRVNHKVEYSSKEGHNNNQCESFNARFRRMIEGQHHHVSTLYLDLYANEVAYREDTRRMSNGDIFKDVLSRCLMTPVHGEWCGYGKGNRRIKERLAA